MYTDESKSFVGILRTRVFHLLFPVEITTVNEYAVHSYE